LHEYQSRRAALLSVFFFNIYPTSYFMTAAYTEGLYFIFILLMFYCLRRRGRIYEGAGAAACAILTRTSGITAGPVLFLDWLLGIKSGKRHWRDGAALLLPAVSIGVYLGINRYYYGDWFYFLEHYSQTAHTIKLAPLPFGETLSTLKELVLDAYAFRWDSLHWYSRQMMTLGWGSLFTVTALGFTLYGVYRRLPAVYTVYGLFTILFYSSFRWGISNARYSLAVLPIFMVLGRLEKTTSIVFWSLVFIPLLLIFTARFTSGGWAF